MPPMSASHDRYPYSPIAERPVYDWPGGKRLAVYIALNLEWFSFGEGLGAELAPGGPQPDVLNYAWRDYGNRVGVFRLAELFAELKLPVSLLVKHFEKCGNAWQLAPNIRGRVAFQKHNLIAGVPLGVFDVIFCRNVLIYFDEATKRDVLARLASQLAGDGYLVLGASETTRGLSDAFVPVADGCHGIFKRQLVVPKAVAAA